MRTPVIDKFSWLAWRSDRELRACGFAARGLWMDMLCIAAEAERKGFVMIAGRACDAIAIARVTGGQVEEVEQLLAELERNGVFSRDVAGVIYCRRMVGAAERSRTASEYGRRGGARPELPLGPLGSPLPQPPGVGVNPHPPGSCENPTLSLSLKKKDSDSEQKKESKEDSKLRPLARGPLRLPDDWTISEADTRYAISKGFASDEIAALAEHFANHHWKKGTKWERWDSAWKTWILNEIKFARQRGNPRGGHSGAPNGQAKITPADLASGRFRRTP